MAATMPQVSVLEQRIFEKSPAGTLATSVAIFAVLMGSFEAAAALTHYPIAYQISLSINEGGFPAVIMSLLIAVALGMQRYVRLKDLQDAPALARVIRCDVVTMTIDNEVAKRRILRAGFAGAAIGLVVGFLAVPPNVRAAHIPVLLWFVAVTMLLGAMFGRGIIMTRIAARNFSERIDRDLTIDLLRVDALSVIGKSSARAALIWLSVAAVISLFFVSGHIPALVIATIVVSSAMAFWIFFRSLEHVHRKIRDAKYAELEGVRSSIAEQRIQAGHDHTAAARLQGLLAYESRIEHVHEWPFDQPTLLRVAAYILIPAAPAIGQLAMRLISSRLTI